MGTQTTTRAVELIRKTELSPSSKLVLLYIAHCYNEETGKCCPKMSTIAENLGITERTVASSILDLRGKSLLTAVKKGKLNHYSISGDHMKTPSTIMNPFSKILEVNRGIRTRTEQEEKNKKKNKKSPTLAGVDSPICKTSPLGKGDLADIESRFEAIEDGLAKLSKQIAEVLKATSSSLTLAEKSTKILSADKTDSIKDPLKRALYVWRRVLTTEYPELTPLPQLTAKETGFLKACLTAWNPDRAADVLRDLILNWENYIEWLADTYRITLQGVPTLGKVVAHKGEVLMWRKQFKPQGMAPAAASGPGKSIAVASSKAKRWSEM